MVKNAKFNNCSHIWKIFIINFTDEHLKFLPFRWPQSTIGKPSRPPGINYTSEMSELESPC